MKPNRMAVPTSPEVDKETYEAHACGDDCRAACECKCGVPPTPDRSARQLPSMKVLRQRHPPKRFLVLAT